MPNPSPSPEKPPPVTDYTTSPLWRNKSLTPSQLLVNDIRLEQWRSDSPHLLEVVERSVASLTPSTADLTPSASLIRASNAARNVIEQQKLTTLEEEYGWMRNLRLRDYQHHAGPGKEDAAKVRWIHCSSKFPDYLRGFLWALSDDGEGVAAELAVLEQTVQRQTRFSKHGQQFAPFAQSLRPEGKGGDGGESVYPMLLSVPFLDWTILGEKPPLRFQIDKREGFQSAKSSAHLARSILQYFFRLEDTTDRESSQIFAKHKPWSTNRELDLKVRQWYGHYPSGLIVDELWVLMIDAQHIVTFSSNQTWKSRWPPLQLASRIADVSFRGIRNTFFTSDEQKDYTAMTHLAASLSGACGMLHRNFWPDMVLCLTDRYAGHLGHLQYRLHRSPSTKLVMDLIACQEELNIVIQITQQQVDLVSTLQVVDSGTATHDDIEVPSPASQRPIATGFDIHDPGVPPTIRRRATFRQHSTSHLTDPMAQLLDNLQRELVDLQDLRDNTDRLVSRTIQLVNIRLEDHGKAILVFTVVTIIFLPLNFVSSFFGMNTSDIRNLSQTQSLFWLVAVLVTAGVVASSVFLAFSGGDILEKVGMWRDARRERQLSRHTVRRQNEAIEGGNSFQVYGVQAENRFSPW